MVEMAKEQNVSMQHCNFVALDEWVGIPPDKEGSCANFLYSEIFNPLSIAKGKIHLFNAMSNEPHKECAKMDLTIASLGGIDLMIVGIGMNGHVGFNEPGTPFDKYAHVVDLDETTRTVGQKYFKEKMPINQGITLGFNHILASKSLLLIANGQKKAAIIKKTVEDNISNAVPATLLRLHTNSIIRIDWEAASMLKEAN